MPKLKIGAKELKAYSESSSSGSHRSAGFAHDLARQNFGSGADREPLRKNRSDTSRNDFMPKNACFFWCHPSEPEEFTERDNYSRAIKDFHEKFPDWKIEFFVDDVEKVCNETNLNRLKNIDVLSMNEIYSIIKNGISHPETYKVIEFIDGIKSHIPAAAKDVSMLAFLLKGCLYSDISTLWKSPIPDIKISDSQTDNEKQKPRISKGIIVGNTKSHTYENAVFYCKPQKELAYTFAKKTIDGINKSLKRSEYSDGTVIYTYRSNMKNGFNDVLYNVCFNSFTETMEEHQAEFLTEYAHFESPESLYRWSDQSLLLEAFKVRSRRPG